MVPQGWIVIRVGLAVEASQLGAINYFRNLLTAIANLPDRQIEPVLLIGERTDSAMFTGLPAVDVIRSDLFDRMSLRWVARKVCQQVFASDPFLERFLRSRQIDVLSHSDFLGRNASLPTICWIPDFQHRQLPEFFKASERRYRDRDFSLQCRHATRILVSSRDAQRALAAFQPSCLDKSRILQFVAQPVISSEMPGRSTLEARYGFTGPYFHVPNQFWAHKNHRLILDALAILKARGQPVVVLATGATTDYRQPHHFDELMAYADAIGVSDLFRPLGVVPYSDLVGLMVHAIAIVNPSRAEGWSTSVEEGKSLGKRMILSDLPVHHEQSPTDAVYVDPDNPLDMAEAMWRFSLSHDPAAERERMEQAQRDLPHRVHSFARAYEQIVLDAWGHRPSPG